MNEQQHIDIVRHLFSTLDAIQLMVRRTTVDKVATY